MMIRMAALGLWVHPIFMVRALAVLNNFSAVLMMLFLTVCAALISSLKNSDNSQGLFSISLWL